MRARVGGRILNDSTETAGWEENAVKRKWNKGLLIALCCLAALCIAGLAAMPPYIVGGMTNGHFDVQFFDPQPYGVAAERLQLTTEDGLNLAAWATGIPDANGTVILLSGIQSPSVTAFWGYAKLLNDNGYNALLVEMRAHGESEGDAVCLGMKEWLDVKAAVQYIDGSEALRNAPIVVWGTSMGGATAINAAGEIPEIDGVIACSAYSSYADAFCDTMLGLGLPAWLVAAERPFVDLYLGLTYGFGNLKIAPVREIGKLNGRPALLMHSTQDSQVDYTSFERLVKAAPNVETFVRAGDHHFICYEAFQDDPAADAEFSAAVLGFLDEYWGAEM